MDFPSVLQKILLIQCHNVVFEQKMIQPEFIFAFYK